MEEHKRWFDVCIVCASYEEAKAVLDEFSSRCHVSFIKAFRDLDRHEYRYTSLHNLHGEVLTILVTWLSEGGAISIAHDLSILLQQLQPRFFAMTGICTGDKNKVQLGDLVVASAAYRYNEGKIIRYPEGHLPARRVVGPADQVLQYAQGFEGWQSPVVQMKEQFLERPLQFADFPKRFVAPMASSIAYRADNPFPSLQQQLHRDPVAFDLETASFYHTLRMFPYALVVKGVSAYLSSQKINDNYDYRYYAAHASAVYMLCFIQEYVTEQTMPRLNTPNQAELSDGSNVSRLSNLQPDGWIETTIGDIANINPGVDIFSLPDSMLVSFVPMVAIEAGTGRMDSSQKRRLGEVKRGYTAFLENDILFAKITPCMENGKFAVAQGLSSGIGFGSTEFHILRPKEGINSHLLYYYLSQEKFKKMAQTAMAGAAGYLRVPAAFLANAFYPLAPTNEQSRIVAAIEQQFTSLDSEVATLHGAQRQTKQYRASLLKSAVEGELTKEWRAKNSISETGAQLLAHILIKRRAHWEMEQLTKMNEKGVIPRDDKWKQTFKEPQSPDVENLPTLPEGWCWATVEQLADVSTGATPLKSREEYYKGGTIPWITSRAVNADFITSAEEFITNKAVEETNVRIFPIGTLVLTMYGEEKARGKVAELKIAAATNQACAAIVFRSFSFLCQPYIKYFLFRNYLEVHTFSPDSAPPNVNLTTIKNTVIPFPPLAEQTQIVTEVEARLFDIVQSEKIIDDDLRRAERVRQSILQEAFAGRLVLQDSTDESASALLERIQEERKRRAIPERRGPKKRIHKNITRWIETKQRSTGQRYMGLYEKLIATGRPVLPTELFDQIKLKADKQIDVIESFYEELNGNERDGLIRIERDEEETILSALEPNAELKRRVLEGDK